MSAFLSELARFTFARREGKGGSRGASKGEDRHWIFVPYDQLTDQVGPLSERPAEELGIILIETLWKPRQRAYHKQKLALVPSSMRHFALEQAERGVSVEYLFGEEPYAEILAPFLARHGAVQMMEAAEWELRENLRPLAQAGQIEVVPNETWFTTRAQFDIAFHGGKQWRMDRFYRQVRRDADILMEAGKPVGGKFSFDAENRKRWPGEPAAPEIPIFPEDGG